VNKGPAARSGARMNHDPGRLFDYRQIFILKIDLERELLGGERSRFEGTEIDFDRFSTSNLVSGFVVASFDEDSA